MRHNKILIAVSSIIFTVAFVISAQATRFSLPEFDDAIWLVLALVIHDAYFYWCHRLLHHRKFWRFHRAHHNAKDIRPFDSLKVNPVEATLEAAFLPAAAMIGRPSIGAFALFALVMMTANWFGHGGTIFGVKIPWKFWGANSPEDHFRHHYSPSHNFSAYFSWWDVMFGTRWKDESLFRAMPLNNLTSRSYSKHQISIVMKKSS